MSCMSEHHRKLTDGVGKCSVPMWMGGCPAGLCDEPAYGEQTKEYLRGFAYLDPQYHQPAFAMGLACPAHGGPEKPSEKGIAA